MQQEEQIIEHLGIEDLPKDEQLQIIEGATIRIGLAVDESLTDQQRNEYQAIIDDNQTVIDAWLSQNVPAYKDSPVYQEIEGGYSSDPERNRPEKLFASLAWVQLNIPNLQEVIDKALDAYKLELQAAS